METVIRHVRDLDREDRSLVEKLVGHKLRESEKVVIQVTDSANGASAETPHANALPAWCDVYEGLSEAEIDDLDRSIRRSHSSRIIP